MNAEEALELVETMASEYPAADRLAQVVSLAVRIEPELLRKARLTLLPEIDAGAEADLWFSPLVQSQSPLAMTFLPEVRELLRAKLALDHSLLRDAWELLNEFHENAPPALRLEEEVTWLALSGEDNAEVIKNRLDSVIAAIVKDNRPGLVQWANRALPAMPPKARDSDAARILSLVSAAEETVANLNLPASTGLGTINDQIAHIISRTLPKVPVGVRLLTEEAETQGESDNESADLSNQISLDSAKPKISIEFTYPPATQSKDGSVIEVPQTNPLLIEVSWADELDRRVERISLDLGETRRVPVGSSELDIRTALGNVHKLKRHFDFDFFLYFNNNKEDTEWSDSLKERLEHEVHEGRTIKSYNLLVSPYTSPGPVVLSRKVGLVMAPESVEKDWNYIKRLALKRGDASPISDWLIPIHYRPCETPTELRTFAAIDFGEGTDFEQSYRQLVAAITSEPIAVSAPETKAEPEETPVPPAQASIPMKGFISYAHTDERFRAQLVPHLKSLEREGLITNWDDSVIAPGLDWKTEIEQHLNTADIILCLVSADYLSSDFLWGVEIKRAMERQKAGEAYVIPIIVRPSNWERTPLAELHVFPRNGKPITTWKNRDAAYLDITDGIRKAIEGLKAKREGNIKWALDVIQSLALAFHVGRLEPERLHDDEALKQFYELRSDLDLGDFRHVRKMCEYVFAHPVTEYFGGKDPFRETGEAQLDELRKRIDQTRSDPGEGLSLSFTIRNLFARAEDADRQKIQGILGENVTEELAEARLLPKDRLARILDSLSSTEFLMIAAKYTGGFYQFFDSSPTTLIRSRDFPTYIENLINLWREYIRAALKHRGDSMIEVGFAVPSSSLKEFQRRFPDIAFERRNEREGRQKGEDTDYAWSIGLRNFDRAVSALEDVILRALKAAALAYPVKLAESKSSDSRTVKSKPRESRVRLSRDTPPTLVSKTSNARSASQRRAAKKVALKTSVTKKSSPTRGKVAKKRSVSPSSKSPRKNPVRVLKKK